MKLGLAILFGFFCVVQAIDAATRYVDASPHTPVAPYTGWGTAATNIQDAINSSFTGDMIWVADGTYQFGTMALGGANNRIYTGPRTLRIQSVNGPEVTIIKGSTNNASPVRCATLANGSILAGFTLRNGMSSFGGGGVYCTSSDCLVTNCILTANTNSTSFYPGGGAFYGVLVDCLLSNNVSTSAGGGAGSNTLINCTLVGNQGGGAYKSSLSNCLLIANFSGKDGGGAVSCVLNNCVVSNNVANGNGGGLYSCTVSDSLISSNRAATGYGGGTYTGILTNCVLRENVGIWGGGAYNGTLVNCMLASNSTVTSGRGGGAESGLLKNCLLTGNSAFLGAGISDAVANNCTLVGNLATGSGYGAGAYNSTLNNSIIYYNQAATNADTFGSALTNCCTSSLNNTSIGQSFTNEPLFVDANGDFHLQSDSPCINAGNNSLTTNTNDLDGNLRNVGGTVDVGAYEFQFQASQLSYAWLQHYGLPTDGSVDDDDTDNDGMSNRQEWIADTIPTDASSLLQMYSPVPAENLSSVTISWQSVATKKYFIQRSGDLSAFATIQTNITGQPGVTTYTDGNTTNVLRFFYRVGVQ